VADLFASYDRCELLFRFSAERWLDDALVFASPMAQASELAITANLQFALNNLGYTIGVPQDHGNRHPATAPAAMRRRRWIISHGTPKSRQCTLRHPSSSASTRSCRSRT
jgi:hypothetical protein